MTSIGSYITNPIILFIGVQQIVAGAYSLYTSNWRIALISVLVGISNMVLSTMKG